METGNLDGVSARALLSWYVGAYATPASESIGRRLLAPETVTTLTVEARSTDYL
jgi:hypothetical protein